MDAEIEAQRGTVTCPRSHSRWQNRGWGPSLDPEASGVRYCLSGLGNKRVRAESEIVTVGRNSSLVN